VNFPLFKSQYNISHQSYGTPLVSSRGTLPARQDGLYFSQGSEVSLTTWVRIRVLAVEPSDSTETWRDDEKWLAKPC
jgi:hypothetical protein